MDETNVTTDDASEWSLIERYEKEKCSPSIANTTKALWSNQKVLAMRHYSEYPELMACRHKEHSLTDQHVLLPEHADKSTIKQISLEVLKKTPNLKTFYLNIDESEVPSEFGKFLAEAAPLLEHINLNSSDHIEVLADYVSNLKGDVKLKCVEFMDWDDKKVAKKPEASTQFLSHPLKDIERLVAPGKLTSHVFNKFAPQLRDVLVGDISEPNLKMLVDLGHETIEVFSVDTYLEADALNSIATKLKNLTSICINSCIKNIKEFEDTELLQDIIWSDFCCHAADTGFTNDQFDAEAQIAIITDEQIEQHMEDLLAETRTNNSSATVGSDDAETPTTGLSDLMANAEQIDNTLEPPKVHNINDISAPVKHFLEKRGKNLKTLTMCLNPILPVYNDIPTLCPKLQKLGFTRCSFPIEAIKSLASSGHSLPELSFNDITLTEAFIDEIVKIDSLVVLNVTYNLQPNNFFFMSRVLEHKMSDFASKHRDRSISLAMVVEGGQQIKRYKHIDNLNIIYSFPK